MRQLKKTFCKFASLLCLMTAVMAGCEDGPKVVPVDGVLTLDGDPLPFKTVTLRPTEGTEGQGASGYSNTQGDYVLKAFVFGATKDYDGCPPGKYKVVIGEPTIPISEKDFNEDGTVKLEQDDTGVAIGPGMAAPQRSEIPNIYRMENTTPLVVEVPAGGGTINIELTKSGK